MSYPKHLFGPVDLAAFGFEVEKDDPSTAHHKIYPKVTVRHCNACEIWAMQLTNGNCGCSNGVKRKRSSQSDKLYLCECENETCPVRLKAFAMLKAEGISTDIGGDGYGLYVMAALPEEWSMQKKVEFNRKLIDLCVSKFNARQIECNSKDNLRSKLPRATK